MPQRASGPAVVQALGFKCIVCELNLQADAVLIVTAVTPHALARRVQTQATSDHFL